MRFAEYILFIIVAFLLACGDDTTEVISQTKLNYIDVVSKESDLPECSEDNAGEQVFVKADSDVRTCVDGEWTAAVATTRDTVLQEKENMSCYTTELADKKGYKVVCNGDSIGVFLNGNVGIKGDVGDDGVGCSLTPVDSVSARLVCSSDTAMIFYEPLPPDTVPDRIDSLSGCVQKGPFLKGSRVALYEIVDTATLKQSGVNFAGEVDEDGCYKLSAVNLASEYAALVADGRYLNEATGDTSKGEIRLRAFTDMAERSVANVNVLTHLEYKRVNYLVSQKKMSFKQAKKQAQTEVLEQFYIDASDFEPSENLNIFGEKDGDAALLALSILLQGGRSESEFVSFMAEISNALEMEGKWERTDMDSIRAAMADWIIQQDLKKIRKNVEGMNNGKKVGKFEKYIYMFVRGAYFLEPCGERNDGKWRQVANEWSTFFEVFFACTEVNPEIVYNWMVDWREKRSYRTIEIGEQIWMAENLNYETADSHCYNDSAENCVKYGRLYTWPDAMDSAAVFSDDAKGCGYDVTCTIKSPARGICPEGWHIPDTTEWKTLYTAMDESLYAMQAKGFDNWPNATDEYGFSAVPTGYYQDDRFSGVDLAANIWSATAGNGHNVYYWTSNVEFEELRSCVMLAGIVVRCLKDSAE